MDILIMLGIGAFVLLVFIVTRRNRLSKESNTDVSTEQEETKSPWEGFIRFYLYLYGPTLVIFGIIHTVGIITGDVTYVNIADAIFNFTLGVVYIICAVLYSKNKQSVIWIYIASVIGAIIYAFAMGRGFNFYIAIFGGFVSYQLLKLREMNVLT